MMNDISTAELAAKLQNENGDLKNRLYAEKQRSRKLEELVSALEENNKKLSGSEKLLVEDRNYWCKRHRVCALERDGLVRGFADTSKKLQKYEELTNTIRERLQLRRTRSEENLLTENNIQQMISKYEEIRDFEL